MLLVYCLVSSVYRNRGTDLCAVIFSNKELINWHFLAANSVATKLFVSQSVKNKNKCFASRPTPAQNTEFNVHAKLLVGSFKTGSEWICDSFAGLKLFAGPPDSQSAANIQQANTEWDICAKLVVVVVVLGNYSISTDVMIM